MFLHGEDIAPSLIPYKCKNAKMQKCKVFLYPIDLQYDIMFLLLQNLCISLQKGQKRVHLRGCFCIEMPHRTHKSHRNQVGFCVFGVWLYVILNEIHAEGSGCQQPTANGFRLLVEVFRCLREAFESIFSKSRFAFLRFCKRKRKGGFKYTLLNQ